MIGSGYAHAQTQSFVGVWKGHHQCGPQVSNLTLTIAGDEWSGHTAVFAFETVRGLIATGSFEMAERRGRRGETRQGELRLTPGRWISQPQGYQSLPMTVRISPDGTYLQGNIDRCGGVTLVRASQPPAPPPAIGSRLPNAGLPPGAPGGGAGNQPGMGGADSIEGRWHGVTYCYYLGMTKLAPGDVSLELVASGQGTYRGRFNAGGADADYSVAPPMERNHSYPYRAQNLTFGSRQSPVLLNVQRIVSIEGRPQYMYAPTSQPCTGAFLARFERIDGLGGPIGNAADLPAMCAQVAEWLRPAEEERAAARALKVRLSRVLASYNAEAPPAGMLFADDHFRSFFGVSIKELGAERARRLFRQMSHCAFMTESRRIDEMLGQHIFVAHALAAVRQSMNPSGLPYGRKGWDPESGIPLQRDYGALVAAAADLRTEEDGIGERLAGWKDIRNPEELERFVQARVPRLQYVRPTLLAKHLVPIEERLKELATQKTAAQGDARRSRARERFRAVSIPKDIVPAAFAGMIESLAAGEPVNFDGPTMMFGSGLSYSLLDSCGLPKSMGDRTALVDFLRAGQERATLGSDYSNPDIVAGLSSTFRSNAQFLAGVQFARAVGCGGLAEALADAMVDAVKSNASDGAGDDPIFVRTCALSYDRQRCECLASIGRTVLPNIYQMPYDRDLIARIIGGNPLVAAQIPFRCNINTY